MATEKPRFSVTIDEETLDQVDEYKYKNKISTQSKAIVQLVRMGLQEMGIESGKKQPRCIPARRCRWQRTMTV